MDKLNPQDRIRPKCLICKKEYTNATDAQKCKKLGVPGIEFKLNVWYDTSTGSHRQFKLLRTWVSLENGKHLRMYDVEWYKNRREDKLSAGQVRLLRPRLSTTNSHNVYCETDHFTVPRVERTRSGTRYFVQWKKRKPGRSNRWVDKSTLDRLLDKRS